MNIRRKISWIAICAVLGLFMPGWSGPSRALAESKSTASKRAEKSSKRAKKRTKKRRRRRAKKTKVCRRYKGKRRCRWIAQFSGSGVAKSKLRTEPLPTPTGEIWVYAVNFQEEVKVNIYSAEDELSEDALAALDGTFRCRRTGEERAVDPHLYEVLSIIYDHFGGRRIELVSGFRNQRNEGSRHYHASAMDIRIPGVSMDKLYKFATSLDLGNMGIGRYPTSGFVHIDFRAPGEKSYRWTDYSGPDKSKKTRRKKRKQRRRDNT